MPPRSNGGATLRAARCYMRDAADVVAVAACRRSFCFRRRQRDWVREDGTADFATAFS